MSSDSSSTPPAAAGAPGVAATPLAGTPMPLSMAPVPVIKPPLSYTQKVMIAVGISGAAILLAAFAYSVSQILILCFAGLLFSVFLSAPADLLAKYAKIQRTYALLIVLATFALIVAGGGSLMGYTISRQSQELARTLPGALKQFERDMEHRLAPAPATAPATESAAGTPDETPAAKTQAATTPTTLLGTTAPATEPLAESAATEPAHSWLADKLIEVRQAATDFLFSEAFVRHAGGVAGGVVTSTFGIIGNVFIVFGIGLFMALNPRLYTTGLVRLIPPSRRHRMTAILGEVVHRLQWWFVAQLCSMTSTATLTFIGLSILRVPMAITLAIIAGLMNFIPNFGPIIAGVPAVLIAFAPQGDQTSLNPARAGWVILLYFAVQMLDGWVVSPFFQQRTVSLPPALIILSQVVLAILVGPIGLLLATPILAATLVIVRMVYIEDVLGDVDKPKLLEKL